MHMRRWVLRLTIAYQKARHTGTFATPFVNGSATIQKRDTGQALCSCLWRCARLGPATANWTGDISLEGWSLQNLRSALLRCKAVFSRARRDAQTDYGEGTRRYRRRKSTIFSMDVHADSQVVVRIDRAIQSAPISIMNGTGSRGPDRVRSRLARRLLADIAG